MQNVWVHSTESKDGTFYVWRIIELDWPNSNYKKGTREGAYLYIQCLEVQNGPQVYRFLKNYFNNPKYNVTIS